MPISSKRRKSASQDVHAACDHFAAVGISNTSQDKHSQGQVASVTLVVAPAKFKPSAPICDNSQRTCAASDWLPPVSSNQFAERKSSAFTWSKLNVTTPSVSTAERNRIQ